MFSQDFYKSPERQVSKIFGNLLFERKLAPQPFGTVEPTINSPRLNIKFVNYNNVL